MRVPWLIGLPPFWRFLEESGFISISGRTPGLVLSLRVSIIVWLRICTDRFPLNDPSEFLRLHPLSLRAAADDIRRSFGCRPASRVCRCGSPTFVEVDGGNLYYEEGGQGRQTVVLIHDGVVNSAVWNEISPESATSIRFVMIGAALVDHRLPLPGIRRSMTW